MADLTISVSELRHRFDEYIHRVKMGEAIVITRYGKPVAELIPAQMIQDRRNHALTDQPKKKRG